MSRRIAIWAACATVWWLAFGWLSAHSYVATTGRWGIPSRWSDALLAELVSAALWIPLTVLALWLAARFPLGRPSPRTLAVHLSALALAVLGRTYLVSKLDGWLGCYPALPPVGELLATSGQQHAFTYLLITGVGHALYYASAYYRRETELAHAELAALRAQVRPHFLLNALNTIAATVPEDPVQAERMIADLGTLLHRSLDLGEAQQVPVWAELELARCYLAIEQARYTDRLRVSWDIDPVTRQAMLPPLVLLPLVENAVRHGLVPQPAGGHLRISAARRGDRLQLVVEDDGAGLAARQPVVERVGLGNTRSRLRASYGSRHTLTMTGRPAGGVRVELMVPFRTDTHASARTSARIPLRPVTAP